jgi:DNA end-binding protein Ku
MPQTVWKGTISFGLVSIPVRLVSATEERDISFRQVRRSDGSRVRYRRVAEADGEEVPYSEIAKGYELPDGDMIVLTDEDLADLPIASGRSVEVLSFVPLSEIDPTALARAYYAEPSGDPKPYVLLRDALEKSGRVAVVKMALRNRERLAVLRPRDGVLVVQTMLWPDEVRRADVGLSDGEVTVRPQEMAMAESYIDALSGHFEPGEYRDEYREALETLVQAKVEGREVAKAPEAAAPAGDVVDLMEALRRSVAAARAARGEDGAAGAEDVAAGGDGGTTRGSPATSARSGARKPAKTAAKEAKEKAPAKPARARKSA